MSEPQAPTDVPDADPESVARNIVLRQLTMAPRSRHQLAEALAKRGTPSDVSERVLDRMQEVGLINDLEFAQGWVRSRRETKGLARRALRHELKQKGIAEDIIEAVLFDINNDHEAAAAEELVRKRLRATLSLDPAARRRRLIGMLGRKGYSPMLASRIVDDALDLERSEMLTP